MLLDIFRIDFILLRLIRNDSLYSIQFPYLFNYSSMYSSRYKQLIHILSPLLKTTQYIKNKFLAFDIY